MSRQSRTAVEIPKGVEVAVDNRRVTAKGPKGTLHHLLHPAVAVFRDDGLVRVAPTHEDSAAEALVGTTRALVKNMMIGVSRGFQRRLQLVGVGYRAQMKGSVLNLALGYSHPIEFPVPEGVSIETPSQTEILVSGIDKQRVGQTAAVIRAFRAPEPYKGKGIRYADEHVVRKEAKKK
jgi:large subunit ribosomal protein L6